MPKYQYSLNKTLINRLKAKNQAGNILAFIDGDHVNFGTNGAFVHESPPTKMHPKGYTRNYREATQKDLESYFNRGSQNLVVRTEIVKKEKSSKEADK